MSAKQQLFEEINRHLISDEKPSTYFNGIKEELFFSEVPFTMLSRLKNTPQSPQHHPEGNVWNHTMLVTDEAAKVKEKSKNANVFMWAALLHDIGKADTTKIRKDRITSYDHEKLGETLSKRFLSEFIDDEGFIESVAGLIRWHMQILFVVKSMPFADIKMMKQQTDVREVALLGLCDRLGRLDVDEKQEQQNINLFLQKCNIQGIL
ncbi:HDIG domain-containing metalloprotein [Oscillospiraceae bacterium PP1C4]